MRYPVVSMCPWDNPVDAIDYVTTGVYNIS